MIEIPGYADLTQIGESAEAIVFRAKRISDRQAVIIKLLRYDRPGTAELARYQQEYDLICYLNRQTDTKGIIRAIDLQSYQHSCLLILEDFGGVSLGKLLAEQNRPFTPAEFLPMAIAAADALAQIHAAHVIHKDLNPENILFNLQTGQLKIIDFGISTLLERQSPVIAVPSMLEGTLAYISPEQTGRMNRALDYRTDFYSLGITFYELLTGRLPFLTNPDEAYDDAIELVHAHIAKQPPSLTLTNQQVPPALAAIVMKLIAKMAEDRYQSAYGLKFDLEQCWQQLQQQGMIAELPIASRDFSDRFQIPQKLYGRSQDIATLMAAFERISKGAIEMVLLTGYAGIGKTALVQEIYKPITSKRGYFVAGKFDQLQSNIPYSAIVNAFTNLIRQLLTETEAQLEQWRQRILAALGSNISLISQVIPELELIVGNQPPPPSLDAAEVQNLFNLAFQDLVRVFTCLEQPFAIFLDDLQWADPSSLKLINLMITAPESHSLVLIGAYRDHEVDAAHPLMLCIEEMKQSGATVNQITIAPISLTSISQLIADTLHCPVEQVTELAELVNEKTGGNPFFVNEFLKSLAAEQLIYFDWQELAWRWEIAKIRERNFTDNVVTLMAGKLQKLPLPTQRSLSLAACIGNQFNLATLAIIKQTSCSQARLDLQAAIATNLILPLTQAKLDCDAPDVRVEYKFAHDRIQQAAYGLISDHQCQELHWQIGQILWQENHKTSKDEVKEPASQIFAIVNQLNLGKSSLIAQLNQRANDSQDEQVVSKFGQEDQVNQPEQPYELAEQPFDPPSTGSVAIEQESAPKLRDIANQTPDQQDFSQIKLEFEFDQSPNVSTSTSTSANAQISLIELASLNLKAAQKAQAANAYETALNYLQTAIELLSLLDQHEGKSCWQTNYQLALELYTNGARVAYLNGDFELMQQWIAQVLEHCDQGDQGNQDSDRLLDQVAVYEVLIQAQIAQNQPSQAIRIAIDLLKKLGIKLPTPDRINQTVLGLTFINTELLLLGKKVADLAQLPIMQDPAKLAAIRIMIAMTPAAFFASPPLFFAIMVKMVGLSARYGNAPASAWAYANYGLILCSYRDNIDRGYQFGSLAHGLVNQLKTPELKAKVGVSIASSIRHWHTPLADTLPTLLEAYQSGLETGDLQFAANASMLYCLHGFFSSKPLPELAKDLATYITAINRLNQQMTLNHTRMLQQVVHKLIASYGGCESNVSGQAQQIKEVIDAEINRDAPIDDSQTNQGNTTKTAQTSAELDSKNQLGQSSAANNFHSSTSLDGQYFNEATCLADAAKYGDRLSCYWFYLFKLMLCYWFEETEAALDHAKQAQQYLAARASTSVPSLYFYVSLTYLAAYSNTSAKQQKQLLKQVNRHQKRMQRWAKYAPMNYLHKYYLITAEKQRVLDRCGHALEFYDLAINAALEHGYTNEAALAYELAAKCYAQQGKKLNAQAYMQEAHYLYNRWGAIAKAEFLVATYPELLCSRLALSNPQTSTLSKRSTLSSLSSLNSLNRGSNRVTSSTTGGIDPASLDLASVMKASQAISGEILLDRLLAKLMQIMLENAGAQLGYLLLETKGKLYIEAAGQINRDRVAVLQSLTLDCQEASELVARGIINYVARTGETVVLSDAAKSGRFTKDPYVVKNQPKSVLCSPLTNQGKLSGILYLENNLTTHAFTQESLDLLDLLSGQAAIAIENARFYNSMAELNKAYERFVPGQFLRFLNKDSIVEVQLGDQVQKEMSVLFADIRNFTSLSETMTPEENFHFINSFFGRMEPAIAQENGFIDKYIGDAIMALFGGETSDEISDTNSNLAKNIYASTSSQLEPLDQLNQQTDGAAIALEPDQESTTHTNSADDAVRAGIAMLQALIGYNQTRAQKNKPPIAIGIGINTGLLMLGTVGGKERMDSTVISDAVNLASRIEGKTKEYVVSLLISEDTYQQLEDPSRYSIRMIDRVRVRGKNRPVALYEVFETDPPMAKASKLATAAMLAEALTLYEEAKISAALALFQTCAEMNPSDRVAQIQVTRCKQKLKQQQMGGSALEMWIEDMTELAQLHNDF
ncbi:adenylate/guanylate cyclase with GAF sensor(s) [Thalassoporum mexicanum PCC 7367]|uniref:AAA family ATPase n=1 Tax=Thalassoporum mexicanum TaxID=3457544 RepID=UPI00029F8B9F|nr:AAA family ATPase [Pseudanabaena sp. PCC 7367]AFY69062.1 adenylate/guanylate cyclase with GAF sensor(s) [Pseudanabaena sp. PCC 7367]